MLLEPFVHRSHLPSKGWNGNHSQLPRVSMQFLQQRGVLRPPDTDLHTRTSVHLWAWFAHRQSSWLHNTSWLHALHNSLKFGRWCAVCWTTHGRRISSQPHSHFSNGIWIEVIFTSFQTYIITDLRHYRLTSLSNHSIHRLPQYKVRRDSVSCWTHRVQTFWLIQLVVGFLFSLKSYKQLTLPGPTGHPNSWTNRSYKIQNVQRPFSVKPTGGTEAEDREHSKSLVWVTGTEQSGKTVQCTLMN